MVGERFRSPSSPFRKLVNRHVTMVIPAPLALRMRSGQPKAAIASSSLPALTCSRDAVANDPARSTQRKDGTLLGRRAGRCGPESGSRALPWPSRQATIAVTARRPALLRPSSGARRCRWSPRDLPARRGMLLSARRVNQMSCPTVPSLRCRPSENRSARTEVPRAATWSSPTPPGRASGVSRIAIDRVGARLKNSA